MADQLLSAASYQPDSLPASYVRPESQRPRLHEVISDAAIPTVDLGSPDHPQIVAQIADACRHYGFFQVVNHGVGKESMRRMMEVAQEFFRLPAEEKAKHYSDDPTKKIRLSTSFNIRKETVRNWRDYLRLHCYPLEDFTPEWPSIPSSFKEVVSVYCKEVRRLGFRLLGLISLGLGLEEEHMVKVLGEQEQHMAINYYPKCPAPDLTYGLQAHTDPNALTILNIGDQLQALSNGRYKSVWHRAIVNQRIQGWILDSGCSHHMSCDRSLLFNFRKLSGRTARSATGHITPILGVGSIYLGTEGNSIIVEDVYFVPGLTQNFLSFGQLLRQKLEFHIIGLHLYVTDPRTHFRLHTELQSNNLFIFDNEEISM